MKGVIRICKPKKDRQHNDQKKKDKRTNNDPQNITHTNNRGELRFSGRIGSSCCTNFMLSIRKDTENEFSYFLLSCFQLII
jgi:hypothetical protein